MGSENSNGIGFFGLLTILFIFLKLTNHISWSWVWVLSPLWISFIIGIIIIIIAVIINKDIL
ncbi:hypothetical protein [Anaerococcus porci]|uniref:hypothetical protein n=1 Tax=Anaerococcus porci TaxID=2652269 RepID=UPI002A7636DE|nr:hypothetical protein [Anaerococcus porci]MDY3007088.1 hypothetical protein [Anaerococcus porci]